MPPSFGEYLIGLVSERLVQGLALLRQSTIRLFLYRSACNPPDSLCVQAGFLPDADAIGCIFRDNSVLVWDSVSYAVKARLQLPDPTSTVALSCYAASANGAHFIAGTRGGSILVWDLVTQALMRVIDMPQPASVVVQVQFLPDNITAAVLCDDGHVVILTVAASTCKAVLDVSAPDRVRFLGVCHVLVALGVEFG
jgi:WD40 repeat protein